VRENLRERERERQRLFYKNIGLNNYLFPVNYQKISDAP